VTSGVYSSGSLNNFLDALPADISKAVTVLGAAVSLTDEIAVKLIDRCVPSKFQASEIVACLRLSDFVVERNGEWKFDPSARVSLLDQLRKEPALAEMAHSFLRDEAREASSSFSAGRNVPTYLTWRVGRAYHTTFFDAEDGLKLYLNAYTGRNTGDQWLLGQLAEEQQERGVLPSHAIEPSFFQGMTAYREKDWDTAENYFRKVIKSKENRKEVAIALQLLGLILQRQRYKFAEAERLMRRSLQIEESLGSQLGQALVLHSLASLIKRNDPQEAETLLERSLELQEKVGEPRGQVLVLQSLGILLSGKDWRRAKEFLHRSLQIEESLGNLSGQAQVMLNLANLIGTKDLTESQSFLRRSLKIEEQTGNLLGQAKVLHSWAQIIKRMNSHEAEKLMRGSLEIGEKVKHLHHQAQVLHSLGDLLGKRNMDEAITFLRRSLKIKERFNDPYEQAQVLNSLGNVFRIHGKLVDASQYYQQVLHLTRDKRALATAHIWLSYIKEEQHKDPAAAIRHAQQAVALIQLTNRRDLLKKSETRLRELKSRYPNIYKDVK
jgi:tetratricopeptide (TPR) repeat protein